MNRSSKYYAYSQRQASKYNIALHHQCLRLLLLSLQCQLRPKSGFPYTADHALHHRYAHAIDAWRAQLVALKDLEDDLTAVLRDRDIL
jgi:hypothetical protein